MCRLLGAAGTVVWSPVLMVRGETGTWLSLLPGGMAHLLEEDFQMYS